MHPHAHSIALRYKSLAAHDHGAMAECYNPDATFEGIAFRLKGKERIHDMWKFVTRPEPQLKATFGIIRADDESVHAWLIDDYTFTETKRPGRNVIVSFFRFHEDGRIIEHP